MREAIIGEREGTDGATVDRLLSPGGEGEEYGGDQQRVIPCKGRATTREGKTNGGGGGRTRESSKRVGKGEGIRGRPAVVVESQELAVNRKRRRSGSSEPAQTDLVEDEVCK